MEGKYLILQFNCDHCGRRHNLTHGKAGEPNIAVTRGNLSPGQLIVAEQELGSRRLRPETRRVER